jgi:pimeloyl-ACP methyl ester carboxylesterase
MIARALYRAVRIAETKAPYDTMHLKVLYPARLSNSPDERNTGHVPVDTSHAPFPVAIFLGGINCCSDSYKWLAVELVRRGLVVVLFDWVGETFPGVIGLTNGVDLGKLRPETYGSAPTTLALPAILTELEALQREGVLAGLLDLQQIILGGHSAGGTIALQNANPKFFPNIKGAFAYGAHNLMSAALGWEAGALAPLSSDAPLLLMGGARDGIIAASAGRYGIAEHQSAYAPIERTFDEAIVGGRGDAYLAIIEGANHTSLIHPPDETTSRAFLDQPTTVTDEAIRALLNMLIGNFIDGAIRRKPEAQQAFEALLRSNPMLAVTKCK